MRIYKVGKKFGVDFSWHGGRVRLVGYSTRRATEAFGRNLEALAACRETGERLDRELAAWLEGLPLPTKEKLAKCGLIDQQKFEATKELSEHLEDYSAHMKAKGVSEHHIRLELSKISNAIKECRFTKLGNITADAFQRYLTSRVEMGKKARTVNSDLVAMRTFCNWAVRYGKIPDSPLKCLQKLKNLDETRRALTEQEYNRFLSATENGGAFRVMSGEKWALLFRLAAETGFRWNELRSLSRAQFHNLTGDQPTVSIKGEDTKNGKSHVQPLTLETAALLHEHLKLKLPSARAFDMPASDCGAKVVQHYLELTADPEQGLEAIPYRDENGLKFDFHALRGQFATSLARSGVSPTIAHKVMRHSDINLTLRYYTHLSLEDSREAIGKLAEVKRAQQTRAVKTGTYDVDERTNDSAENFCQISAKNLPNHADSPLPVLDNSGLSEVENGSKTGGEKSAQPVIEKAFIPKDKGLNGLVAPQGFEPRLNDPESSVLPLD